MTNKKIMTRISQLRLASLQRPLTKTELLEVFNYMVTLADYVNEHSKQN